MPISPQFIARIPDPLPPSPTRLIPGALDSGTRPRLSANRETVKNKTRADQIRYLTWRAPLYALRVRQSARSPPTGPRPGMTSFMARDGDFRAKVSPPDPSPFQATVSDKERRYAIHFHQRRSDLLYSRAPQASGYQPGHHPSTPPRQLRRSPAGANASG